jgi:uracil DNA glycosylase superfamily protein
MVSLAAPVLPDVLAPGLRVVFCGYAPGTASARTGAYYAGPGNRFWITLREVGLTPLLIRPANSPACPSSGSASPTSRRRPRDQTGRSAGAASTRPASRPSSRRPPPRTSPSTARTRPARHSAVPSITASSPSGSAARPSGSSPRPPAPPADSGTSGRGKSSRAPRCPPDRVEVPYRGPKVDNAKRPGAGRGESLMEAPRFELGSADAGRGSLQV